MQQLSVGESIKFGWETFKKRPWILIGGFVLAMAISGVASAVLAPAEDAPMGFVPFLMMLASAVIGLFVEIGLVTFALRAHDRVEAVSINDLWNPAPFWRYLGGQILVGIIVIIGFILLIVPGIIAALGLVFTSYLIIDKGRGPIEAMKESWRITKGHRWQLLLLVLAVAGLNVIGFFLLLVGLLVTVPVSMLAMIHAYRKLEHAASEVTPVPVA
ncbi:MAG TPA: DUF975 family protein [Candidatus Paceibacterota bacterium]|nr:DUF975 family protein [Candidatus Paceibacterota bacterium]